FELSGSEGGGRNTGPRAERGKSGRRAGVGSGRQPPVEWARMDLSDGPCAGRIDSGGGTQKTIRFAGRGADDNNFRFDGVDATAISNQAPNASFRLQISTESIAEFKIDTALFGADTGGTAGGQVEVISKAGSNAFHGSAFEYIRNDKLNSRSPFDPSTLPPLRLNQYGGSLGGPVWRNRTFFFLAYEGLKQRVSNTLIG